MNARQFVESIREVVHRGTVRAIIRGLEDPPGRRPDPSLIELSRWFKALSDEDRGKLQAIIELATGHAAYSVLLILDGLAAIEPSGPKGNLELYYDNGETRVRLNDENADQLSSLFKECD